MHAPNLYRYALTVLTAALLLGGAPSAHAQEFSKDKAKIKPVPVADGAAKISPANTQIEFIGLHVGDDPKPRLGGFAKWEGSLGVEDGKLKSVTVKIDTTSIWTEFDKLTTHLNAADFFHTAEHPTASFQSTQIKPGKQAGTVEISGKLTFMGTTKPLTFPAKVTVDKSGVVLTSEFDFDRITHGIAGHEGGVERLVKLSVVVGQPSTRGGKPTAAQAASSKTSAAPVSGLPVGGEVEPWEPVHVSGPHKGTQACPVCTYMKAPAVVAFAKSGDKTQQMLTQLEQLLAKHSDDKLKAFVVVLDAPPVMVTSMANGSRLRLTSLCYLAPKTREADLEKYKIDPSVENTVMVYKDYKVTANFNNLDVAEDPDKLPQAVDAVLQ